MKKLFISASNRRGVLWVIAFALLIAFIPRILMALRDDQKVVITKTESTLLAEIESRQKERRFESQKKRSRFHLPPRKFNPNSYTKEQWMYLGLSNKQADIVLKFTSRGIDNYEELSKIFVIPSALMSMIKDSLIFETKRNNSLENTQVNTYSKKETNAIELNSASNVELESLPMIGEKLAARIIKYRNRLGGFISKNQLLEVYGLDANTFSLIESSIKVDSKSVTKLSINKSSAEDLKNHPYFNWNIANSIVKLRSQKGEFKKMEEIMDSKLIDFELFEKVKMYLEL